MSALSALASYNVSDDEEAEGGEENRASPEHPEEAIIPVVNSLEIQENQSQSTQEKKKEVFIPEVDEEDIWRDPDEEPVLKQAEETEEKNDNDEESIKIEDLSGIHEESGNENSDDEGKSSKEEGSDDDLGKTLKFNAKRRSKRQSSENATNLAKKLRSASVEEVNIPPEPEGRCSSSLQEKITRFMERKVKDGEDLNLAIQARKDFRNPSIYDKLIVYLGIDELGTNFPPEDYNPKTWRKVPKYDELARAQREDMSKREKERKTKVEFVTGTVKKPATSSGSQAVYGADGVKKSKWDQQTSVKSGSVDKVKTNVKRP